MSRGYASVVERFRAKYDVTPAGCWEWNRGQDRGGYGQFMLTGGRIVKAHQFAYELHKGPVPIGMELDHLCRNRRCVNPEHLEAVTHQVNILRSPIALAGVNARKTQCIRGHEFTPENTKYAYGKRYCRKCGYIRSKAYLRKKRQERRCA